MDIDKLTVTQLRKELIARGVDIGKSRNGPALRKKLRGVINAPTITAGLASAMNGDIPPAPKPKPAAKSPAAPPSEVTLLRRGMKAGTSLRMLCKELQAAGIKTPRGLAKWMPSSVQAALRRHGLAG